MNEKNVGAENTRWDLSFIYSGIDDPQIDADVTKLIKMAKDFNGSHKGNLSKTLSKAIGDVSDITMLSNKLNLYLSLLQSVNASDDAIKAKIAETEKIINEAVGEYLSFFDIELVALDDATLAKFYTNDPIVAKHQPWIEHKRVFKPHLLSEPVESALTKRQSFGPSTWPEFFSELSSDLEFKFCNAKKTLVEMLHELTESTDAETRFELMKIINDGLGGVFAKYSAQTLYIVAGSGEVEDKERSFRYPMEERNKLNRVPDAVVDILHRVVENVGGPLVRRYYRLKASHIGLKTLRWSDRNAPMPFVDNTVIPFEEAMAIVLAAYESFSPTLAEIIREFLTNKWIDAPAIKGKHGGAFSASRVLPNNHPVSFTFLNYLGSNKDVATLAHELGHGVNGILAGKAQGPLMSETPIAYAEIASTFGEMITLNFLKKRIASDDKKALLALIMGQIDDTINTVVRQIGLSNFERRFHGIDPTYLNWNKPKKLSIKEINTIWLETLKSLYGEDGDVFTYENVEYFWTYIQHFHIPFYVYSYALDELLTHRIYAQQAQLGDRFEPLYLEMLCAGDTKNIIKLLEPFGLDPMDENFWADSIRISLGAMLEEAEQLSRDMGIYI